MATEPRRTATTATVVATNVAYNDALKLVLPFEASRLTVSVFQSSGNPTLSLSFDGVNDVARLHHTGQSSTYTFEKQKITTLYYKQSGTDCHFIVNAETQAWPTTVG